MSDKFDHRGFLKADRISPPPISNRVRAQRVLSVEAVMDVERAILWPDSGRELPGEKENNSDETARAQEEKAWGPRR